MAPKNSTGVAPAAGRWSLDAAHTRRDGFVAEVRQPEFGEGYVREVEHLSPPAIVFSVDAVLIVAVGMAGDAAVGVRQQESVRLP